MTQARYQGGYQMTSIGKYKIKDIQKKNPLFSTMEKSSGELQRPGKLLANQA